MFHLGKLNVTKRIPEMYQINQMETPSCMLPSYVELPALQRLAVKISES